MAKAEVVNTACGILRIQNQVLLCTLNWSGVRSADGRMSAPTNASALAGSWRYFVSKYRPTSGRIGSAAMPERLRMRPRCSTLVTCRVSSR